MSCARISGHLRPQRPILWQLGKISCQPQESRRVGVSAHSDLDLIGLSTTKNPTKYHSQVFTKPGSKSDLRTQGPHAIGQAPFRSLNKARYGRPTKIDSC